MKDIVINILSYVWPTLEPVLAAIITGAITAICLAVAKRFKIQTNQEAEQRLRDVTSKAVLAAEEIVESWLKANKGSVIDSAKAKNEKAVAIIKQDYPTLDNDRLQAEIHAALAAGNGLGATKEAKG